MTENEKILKTSIWTAGGPLSVPNGLGKKSSWITAIQHQKGIVNVLL